MLLDDFEKLLQIKRYSNSTIGSYKNALLKFINSFPSLRPQYLQKSDIQFFINQQVVQSKISQSYQKQLVGALKLFYQDKSFTFATLVVKGL